MMKHSTAIACSIIFFLASCKKSDVAPAVSLAPPVDTAKPVSIANLNQTAFNISKDYYLWNNLLPATYNASTFADPDAVMTDIRQYSRESGFTGPVDRWSFAMKKTEWDQLSSGMASINAATSADGDFGMEVLFHATGDLRVKKVEPASPAGAAGIHRGWRITKINGSTNITIENAQYIIDNVYYSTSSTITFVKPDGSVVDITLAAGHYASKPLYLDTVYTAGSSKVGYMVYNSFLGDQTKAATSYARAFSGFASAGITDLVVDLRYNGGGYVSLQEKLANYIVNQSASGGVMMKQIYNTSHSSDNSISYFNKAGSVNLPKVYFIVGRSTASAAELLINNLKPYMDVRLIGPSNTHGKPVGFFPLEDGEWYVFPVSFKTINKNGEGNYYGGFKPNAQVADGVDKDWGDITETSLASALRNISTGNYKYNAEPAYIEPANIAAGNDKLDVVNLKVTIGSKKP